MKEKVVQAGLTDEIHIESAALRTDEIGSDTHHGTRGVLDKYKIPYEKRAARLATKADYEAFDYIIAMDKFNAADMQRLFKADPEDKCSLLLDWPGWNRDIADPWYTHDFETTYAEVDAGCTALLEHLKRSIH